MSAPVVLTVCTGNICRSPLLERLLQRTLDDAHGLGAVQVRSAGTAALVGAEMDERSAALLHELGGDPDGFVARRLTASMVTEADLVLTATREHRAAVVRMVPSAMRRTFTVRELAVLVAQIPDTDLPGWDDPRQALAALAERARRERAALVGLGADELDVVDPYRRDDGVYARLRTQVEQALPQLRRGLSGAGAAT